MINSASTNCDKLASNLLTASDKSSTMYAMQNSYANVGELDLSKQGMQMLDKMNKDEQATFLEFQRRLQESHHVSTASSFIVANELSDRAVDP